MFLHLNNYVRAYYPCWESSYYDPRRPDTGVSADDIARATRRGVVFVTGPDGDLYIDVRATLRS